MPRRKQEGLLREEELAPATGFESAKQHLGRTPLPQVDFQHDVDGGASTPSGATPSPKKRASLYKAQFVQDDSHLPKHPGGIPYPTVPDQKGGPGRVFGPAEAVDPSDPDAQAASRDKLQYEKSRKFREDAMVIVGAWRTAEDPVWNRVYYYNPYTKNATFDVYEVLASGGLEDLLRNLEWTLCVLDPKDYPRLYDLPGWCMDLYDNPKCAGKTCGFVEKGSLVVVIRTQFLPDMGIQVAQIVNPLNPRKFVYAKIGEGAALSYLRPIIGVRNERKEAMMMDVEGINVGGAGSMMARVGDKIDPNDPYNVISYLDPEARYFVCTQNRSENLLRRGGWYQSRNDRDTRQHGKLQMQSHQRRRRKMNAAAIRCWVRAPFVVVFQFEERYGDKLHEVEQHFNDDGSFLVLPTEIERRHAKPSTVRMVVNTSTGEVEQVLAGEETTEQMETDEAKEPAKSSSLGLYGRGDCLPGMIDENSEPIFTDSQLGELAGVAIHVFGKTSEELDTHHAVRRLRTVLRELGLVPMENGEYLETIPGEFICRPGPPKSFTGPVLPFSGVYLQREVEEAAEALRVKQEAERLEQERLRKFDEEKEEESSELSDYEEGSDEEEDEEEEEEDENPAEALKKRQQEQDVDSDDSEGMDRIKQEQEAVEEAKEAAKKERRKQRRQEKARLKTLRLARREAKLTRRAARDKEAAEKADRERLEEEWRLKNQLTWVEQMQKELRERREAKERLVLPMLNKSPDRRSYHERDAASDLYHQPMDKEHFGYNPKAPMNVYTGPRARRDPLSPTERNMDFRRLEQDFHLKAVARAGEEGLSLEQILTARAVEEGDQSALQGVWNQRRGSGTETLNFTSTMESPDRKGWAAAGSEFWDKEKNRKRKKLLPLPGETGFEAAAERRQKRQLGMATTSGDLTSVYSADGLRMREIEMMQGVLDLWKYSHPWKKGKIAEAAPPSLVSAQIAELIPTEASVEFEAKLKEKTSPTLSVKTDREKRGEENLKTRHGGAPIRHSRMGRALNYVPTENLHENALRSRWGRVVGWEPKAADLADIAFRDSAFDDPTSPSRMNLGTAAVISGERLGYEAGSSSPVGAVTMSAAARKRKFQETQGSNKYSYLAELKDVPGVTEDGCILVTEGRDFAHTRILGRLQPNTQLSFMQVLGSRAQIAHVYYEVDNPDFDAVLDQGDARVAKLSVIDVDADAQFRGGWVSLVLFETGEALFSKILPLSEVEQSKKEMARMALASELQQEKGNAEKAAREQEANANLDHAARVRNQTKYSGLTRRQILELQKQTSRANTPEYVEVIDPETGETVRKERPKPGEPGDESKFYETAVHANNMVIIQRETVTGGWREAKDQVWNRVYYLNPGATVRATWDLREVLHDGGLEDLLINQTWHLGVVGEATEGVSKDESWQLEVFDRPIRDPRDAYSRKLPGEKLTRREIADKRRRLKMSPDELRAADGDDHPPSRLIKQGRIIVMTDLNPETGVAKILCPMIPTKENVYAAGELMDLCDPLKCVVGWTKVYSMDHRPLVKNLVLDERGTSLSGVFIADFPERVLLPIQEEQDIESEDVAYVRGGDLVLFSVVAGIRARATTIPKLPGMPIDQGWITIMLPDGKPLFREQMQADRVVKLKTDVAGGMGTMGAASATQTGRSSASSNEAAEAKAVPTVQDGFVLRWADRMRLNRNELEKVAELVTDDHYQEFILNDVKTLKTLELPYEKGKHRAHIHTTARDRKFLDIEKMLKSDNAETRKIGVQKLEELAQRDLQECRDARLAEEEKLRLEQEAALEQLRSEQEELEGDDMQSKIQGKTGVGGTSAEQKLQEAKIAHAKDAVVALEEENRLKLEEEMAEFHKPRDYWESEPEVVAKKYDLRFPADRIEDANVMSSLAKGYLNKIQKASMKSRLKALPIDELPYHELGGVEDRVSVFKSLPELMNVLGTGRQLCDWKLTEDVVRRGATKFYWRNMWTDTRATMQQLLSAGAWKLHIVSAPSVEVFEDGTFEPERSCSVFTKGCVLLVEWVGDDVCRVLCPPLYSFRDQQLPQHGYCPFIGFFQPLAVSSFGMMHASLIDEMLDFPGDFEEGGEQEAEASEGDGTGDVEMLGEEGAAQVAGATETKKGKAPPASNVANEPAENLYQDKHPGPTPIPNPYDGVVPGPGSEQIGGSSGSRDQIMKISDDDKSEQITYRVTPFGSHVSDAEVQEYFNSDFEMRLRMVLRLYPTRKSCLRQVRQKMDPKTGELSLVKNWAEFRYDRDASHYREHGAGQGLEADEIEGARGPLKRICSLMHDDEIIIQHVEGRFAYVLVVKMKQGHKMKAGWVELVDELGNCFVRMIPPEERMTSRNPYFEQMLPETQRPDYVPVKGVSPPPTPLDEEEEEEEDEDDRDEIDREVTPYMSEEEYDGLDVTQLEKLKREKKAAQVNARKAEEERLRKLQEEAVRAAFLENMEMLRPHILPILLQMSEMVDRPVQHLSDYKECRDPIWGRKYFLNIWTSEVLYRIDTKQNVPFVRMFLSFIPTNIHSDFFSSDHKGCRKTAYTRLQRVVINALEIKNQDEHLVKTKILMADLATGIFEELKDVDKTAGAARKNVPKDESKQGSRPGSAGGASPSKDGAKGAGAKDTPDLTTPSKEKKAAAPSSAPGSAGNKDGAAAGAAADEKNEKVSDSPVITPRTNAKVILETKIDLGALNTLFPARKNELEYLCGEDQYLLQGQFMAVLAGLPEVMRFRLDQSLNVGVEEVQCRFVELPRSVIEEERKASMPQPTRRVQKKKTLHSASSDHGSPTTAPPTTARTDFSSSLGTGAQMPEPQAIAVKEVTNNLKFRTPKVLNLSKKPLGEQGAIALQQGFMNGGGIILQELCLWGCGIGNEGAEIVLEYLPDTCKVLWLDDNDIVSISEGVIPENNHIEELYLGSNRLGGGESLPYILKVCKHLQVLDIARNEIGSNRILPVLEYISGDKTRPTYELRHLSAQSNKIAQKVVRQFLEAWNQKRGEEPGFKFEYLDVRYNQMDDVARKDLHSFFHERLNQLLAYECVFEVLNDPLEGLEEEEDPAAAAAAAAGGAAEADSPS